MYTFRFNHVLSHLLLQPLKVLFILGIMLSGMNLNAQTPVTVVIGQTTGLASFFYGPIYRNTTNAGVLNYSRHAYLYTATELGIPSGSRIVKLEWLRKDGGSIAAPNTFNIFMTNTNDATFPTSVNWGTLTTGATQTYANTTQDFTVPPASYFSCPFNVPGNDSFTYTGSNLQIMVDWGKFGIQTGGAINFYYNAASGKAVGIPSQNPMTTSSLLQAATYGNNRPTIRITYVPVPACSGKPVAGNTLSSADSVCNNASFTLSIQNTIPGSGVSYQWQRATNAAFTTGVTTIGTNASLVTSQTSNNYYRCITTCAASGLKDTSTIKLITMSPTYRCYCPSTAVSSADEEIFNFTFGSLNNSSNCTTLAPGPGSNAQVYSNYYNITPPDVERLSNVPLSLQIGTCQSYYTNRSAVYIDYNQDGDFEDAGEMVYSSPTAMNGPHTETATILIPATANLGLTGMRVITSEQSAPISSPCLVYSWGETEDYLINITPTTLCSVPTPGNTISSASSVCSGGTVNLSVQNLTTGQGVSYQWYNSSGAIPGATGFTYSSPALAAQETFYCGVSCSYSGLTVNSTPVIIAMSPFIECYCVSMAGSDADEDIFKFTFNSKLAFTDCNTAAPGPTSILGRYSDFHPIGFIDTVRLGQTIPIDIEVDDCDQAPYYSFGTAIWIDFNRNGSFNDAGERVFFESLALQGPRHVIANITIPCNTDFVGETGMRVTIAEGLAGSNLTPCLLYGFGETEDYKIKIVSPTTCSLYPNIAGNTRAEPNYFCEGSPVISQLSLSNPCLFNNFTYQWYVGNFPGTPIPGATNKTYTTPPISSATTYFCGVSCGGSTEYSSPFTIDKVTVSPTATPASSAYCPGTAPIVINTTSTTYGLAGSITYSYAPSAGLSGTTGSTVTASPGATTVYTVTATTKGCTGTNTFTVNYAPLNVGLTASNSGYFCVGTTDSVTLTASGGATYAFSPATGLSSTTGAVVKAAPTATTTYFVTATDGVGCMGTTSVTVQHTQVNVGLTSSSAHYCIGSSDSVTINANGADNYTYSPSTDLSATSGSSVKAAPSVTTTYTVTGTNTASGCFGTGTITIEASQVNTALAASAANYCNGSVDSVTLTASGATTYSYSPAQGLSSTTDAIVKAAPNATTTYVVTGTNALGCTSSASVTITNTQLSVGLNASSTSLCSGSTDSITLTASGASNYTYDPTNGLSASSGSTVKAAPGTTTTYVVTGTDANTGCSATASVTIQVSPITVSLSASAAHYCVGSTDSVTLNASGADLYTYSPATGLSATDGASIKAAPSVTTTYTVTGTQTATGCSASSTITIQASEVNTALVASSAYYCGTTDSVTLTASGADSYTYDPAQGLSATSGAIVKAAPNATTTYVVTGTNSLGCSNTASVTINNAQVSVGLSASSTSYCLGSTDSVTLSASGADDYTFSPGTGLSATNGSTVKAAPGSTTTYVVTGTNINSGCSSTASATIVVNTITVGLIASSAYYCSGTTDSVTLNASGADNYTYSPSNDLSANSGNSVKAAPTVTTTYVVTGTDNTTGCTGTASVTITSATATVNLSASSPSFCIGSTDSVTLTASGADSYAYSPATGLSSTTGSVVKAAPSVTTTYFVTGTDAQSGCQAVDSVEISAVSNCFLALTVKLYIQGYYDGLGYMKPVLANQGESMNMSITDSIQVDLIDPNTITVVASSVAILNTDGTANATFNNTSAGLYYIAIRHRNGLLTWSANPVMVNGNTYDFTTAANKAYGDNQVEVETGIWAFYSGDLNLDENIDLLDLGLLEIDINNFEFGYKITDINGDGNVDLLDVPVLETNVNNFIFSSHL